MVNVDRVYQRVLALANKEQRGYITPQEFNLLANHAQMDIFEGTECERLNVKDYNNVRQSPLTRPSITRPVYVIRGGNILILNNGTIRSDNANLPGSDSVDIAETDDNGNLLNPANMVMIRRPNLVNWTFIMVNGSAMANPQAADYSDFELHASEETDLVIKILTLAGITIKDPGLYQIGAGEDNKNIQQEKS